MTPTPSGDAEQPMPLIEAQGVSVSFGRRNVLDAVDLKVRAGEIVTLVGLNGAGKSTLIRAILGIIRPDLGKIMRAPGLRIGYSPQHVHRDPILPMTVQRFLTLGAPAPREKLEAMLDEVGADAILDYPLAEISGGEMQRVLLARALLREPGLLATIRDRYGCGVLLVSHDLHLVMAATDTVVCLNRHVCCMGRPQVVLRDPEFISLFGPHLSDTLAIYRHLHDHRHDALGEPLSIGSGASEGSHTSGQHP